MRALDRALRKQHAVVGKDRDGHAPDMRETTDERGAIKRLELMKLAAVNQPRDDLMDVIRRANVVGDNAVEFVRVIFWRARLACPGAGRGPA